MIIQYSPTLVLNEWIRMGENFEDYTRKSNKGKMIVCIYYDDQSDYFYKFYDELEDLNDIYLAPSNLTLEELKNDIDQFLLTMKEMKAFI